MRPMPRWAVPLVLAGVVAAAYSNSLDVPFAFDDWHAVEQNPAIRDLVNLPRFFTDPTTFSVLRENRDLRPLLVLSLALNYQVSGLAPWSYHLVNLVLHWLVCLLVFRIVRDHLWLGPGEAVPVALAAALLVAVHPLNTEAVNYVSSRSALLTTACYLGAFDAAVRRRWGLACLLAAAAMLTKSIAVTLPLAIVMYLLLDRAERRTSGFPWGPLAGLTAVAVAGVAYRLWLLPPSIFQTSRQADVTPLIYFRTQWSALLYYLRLFLWPNALVIDRLDYPWSRSWLDVQAWGSLLAIALIAAVVWRLARVRRAFAFAALWVPITLAAESSVFPLAEAVNEHRPYLAMLGLASFAALAIWLVADAAARRLAAPPPWPFAVVVTGVVTLLGAATYARTEVWRDPLALWIDATRKAPLKLAGMAQRRSRRDARGRPAAGAHDADGSPSPEPLLRVRADEPGRARGPRGTPRRVAALGRRCGALQPRTRPGTCAPRRGLRAARPTRRRAGRLSGSHPHRPGPCRGMAGAGTLLEARGDGPPPWTRTIARSRSTRPTSTSQCAALSSCIASSASRRAAVERYRRVLASNPEHYGAHYQIAVALLATGRHDEAPCRLGAVRPHGQGDQRRDIDRAGARGAARLRPDGYSAQPRSPTWIAMSLTDLALGAAAASSWVQSTRTVVALGWDGESSGQPERRRTIPHDARDRSRSTTRIRALTKPHVNQGLDPPDPSSRGRAWRRARSSRGPGRGR